MDSCEALCDFDLREKDYRTQTTEESLTTTIPFTSVPSSSDTHLVVKGRPVLEAPWVGELLALLLRSSTDLSSGLPLSVGNVPLSRLSMSYLSGTVQFNILSHDV